jgi:hypothetical protein
MARFAVLVSLLTLLAVTLLAQTTPVSDPQALSLAAKSVAAMSGGNAVSDVTLAGSVTWIAGSDTETGTATSKPKALAKAGLN